MSSISHRLACGGSALVFGIGLMLGIGAVLGLLAGIIFLARHLPAPVLLVAGGIVAVVVGVTGAILLFKIVQAIISGIFAFVAWLKEPREPDEIRIPLSERVEFMAEIAKDISSALGSLLLHALKAWRRIPAYFSPYTRSGRYHLGALAIFIYAGVSVWLMTYPGPEEATKVTHGGAFTFGIILTAGIAFVGWLIWNGIDKRSLPTHGERYLATLVATVSSFWLSAGIQKLFSLPDGSNATIWVGIVCLLLIPVSLALYYQCDEDGPLGKLFAGG